MNGSIVTPEFRDRVRGLATPIATGLGRLGLTPNALTVIGFLGTCVAAAAAATQSWLLAGVLVIVFGIFDMFDGALARATGRASKFGAFLDSTLDRTGESLVLAGIAVGCAAVGFMEGVLLAGLAVTFASGVTYTRAKAESLGVHGEVGIAPRPERLVLLSAGMVLAGVLGGVGTGVVDGNVPILVSLGLITILSAITILQRIVHVRQQLGHQQ
jgi:CDP-diacylglycerol--glycerol-3-phosphate 3-phosphatidyltransferase